VRWRQTRAGGMVSTFLDSAARAVAGFRLGLVKPIARHLGAVGGAARRRLGGSALLGLLLGRGLARCVGELSQN
jgi:hypothetical protein